MSEWRTIDSAPKDGRVYEVSDDGRVRVNQVIRKHYFSTKGYCKITVGAKQKFVHRLVALAFLENPEGYKEVNHIDGNKENNCKDNLEWCSRSQNMAHAYSIGLHPGVRLSGADSPNFGRNGRRHPQSMAVRATFPDGSFKDYESQGLAAKDGYLGSKISMCITGKHRTHGGATWMPLPPPPTP